MPEKDLLELVAERTGQGRSRVVSFAGEVDGKIGEGNTSNVYRILTRLWRNRSLSFALKVAKDGSQSEAMLNSQIEIYKKMRSIEGFSRYLPRTFRKVGDGFLITDLSDRGKNLVFSWQESLPNRLEKFKFSHPELLDQFKKMSVESIKIQLNDISQKLTENGLYFASDCIFIVIKPNHGVEIIIGDLENIYENDAGHKDLQYINSISMKSALGFIQDIQANI